MSGFDSAISLVQNKNEGVALTDLVINHLLDCLFGHIGRKWGKTLPCMGINVNPECISTTIVDVRDY
jgi:hypothetical protein